MPSYTLELIHLNRRNRYYIGEDLRVYKTARHCRPLTKDQAEATLTAFLIACELLGHKVEARIVELAASGETKPLTKGE